MMAGSAATTAPPWPRWYRPPGYRPRIHKFNLRAVQISAIREAVQDYYRLSTEDMLGDDRSRVVSHPRQLAMYIAWRHTARPYTAIGRAFNRDHSTVVYAVQCVRHRLATDASVVEAYNAVRKRLAL